MNARLLSAIVLFCMALSGLPAQTATPTPFPFSGAGRNEPPPVPADRPYQPIALDGAPGRPEVKEILDQIGGCDLDGARILFVYNVAKSGEPSLPLDLPAKGAAADSRRTTLVVGAAEKAPERRDPQRAYQQYLQLVDTAQSLFSNIFTKAGLEVVTNPEFAQLLYDSQSRAEAIASEKVFLERASDAALAYDAEYVFLYYVAFKDVGYSGSAQNWRDVQDTLNYEMYRVSDGRRVSGQPFRAAGRSDVDFEDAHFQNIQRLVDVGLDGDLGVQVLRDLLTFCRRAGERGDMLTVGLYYQGTDPSPIAIGNMLSGVLKAREVNATGEVRKRESRLGKGESYQEFAFRNTGTVDELQAFLYDAFLQQNGLEDRFIANFTGTGTTFVVELLDEKRGGDWASSALNPKNRERMQEARRQEERASREMSAVELAGYAVRGTALVEAIGFERQPAAGALLTFSGLVVTDASVARGARNFLVHFAAPDGSVLTFNAQSVLSLDDSKLEVLQIQEFEIPEGVAPLPLGDSDKVQEHDRVFASAPRTPKYPRARGRQGTVEQIQRGLSSEIVHTAILDELTNGAPLLNVRGEVVGICRTALKATGYEAGARQEGTDEKVGDELSSPGVIMSHDEVVRREDAIVKRQFGSAVPTNVLLAVISADELEAVRKGMR